jgi:GNAT superfamily N-acetyltransferase
MHLFRQPSEPQVRRLLNDAKLPTADLTPEHLKHFIGCGLEQAPKGVVGLEIYGPYALLRSLTVEDKTRGHGCGKALVAEAERYAKDQGVQQIYLLTASASAPPGADRSESGSQKRTAALHRELASCSQCYAPLRSRWTGVSRGSKSDRTTMRCGAIYVIVTVRARRPTMNSRTGCWNLPPVGLDRLWLRATMKKSDCTCTCQKMVAS